MKRILFFMVACLLWSHSMNAAADPSCEGRFVNPITDVCWRCIFPLSLGSVQVGKGDQPDTPNPGSPNCRGITVDELQRINFDSLDFTNFMEDLMKNQKIPDNDALTNKTKERIKEIMSQQSSK